MRWPNYFWLVDAMRGTLRRSEEFFGYVPLERRIMANHPLRAIRALIDAALAGLSGEFARLYTRTGRPSIPPERLLRVPPATATQLRSAVPLVCRIGDRRSGVDATVSCENRDRLLDGDIGAKFFAAVLNLPQVGNFCLTGTSRWTAPRPRPRPVAKSFVPSIVEHG
jgi:hypothetical protein